MKPFLAIFAALGITAAASVTVHAQADGYPNKPVRIVVPYPAGGGNDIVSRIMASRLTQMWGQSVIVENRGGAGGNIGTSLVAKSAPDGYTLVMGSLSHTISKALYSDLNFDPQKDFTGVTMVASGSYVLVSNPALPAQTIPELVALAKSKPGALNYASAGNGSGTQLGMDLFKIAAGLSITHVPYKGTGPAVNATLTNEVSLDMDNMLAVLPYVKVGTLRALGVSTLKRSALLPDVPTIAESGYPGFEVVPWYGLLAPAGTPKDIVARISRDCATILKDPMVQKLFAEQGADAVGDTPEHFDAFLAVDFARWARVVQAAGAKIN